MRFDFKLHLYDPLICLEKLPDNTGIFRGFQYKRNAVCRPSETYVNRLISEWEGKPLYLLRNRNKVGRGSFKTGNFYPDCVLQIDTDDNPYISFIHPNGLMHVRIDDRIWDSTKPLKGNRRLWCLWAKVKQLSSMLHHVRDEVIRVENVVGHT